jgi:hypothetical protein
LTVRHLQFDYLGGYCQNEPIEATQPNNEGDSKMSDFSSHEVHAAVVAQIAAEIFRPSLASKASMVGYAIAIGAHGKKASFVIDDADHDMLDYFADIALTNEDMSVLFPARFKGL